MTSRTAPVNAATMGRVVSPRRHGRKIPVDQCIVIGANIRVLRQGKGWTQGKLGEVMGWPSPSTVCAAEGRRDGRQRGFTMDEVERLAAIFGVTALALRTRCANCGGQPPAGFACLACGVPDIAGGTA